MISFDNIVIASWRSGRVGLRRHPAKVLCGVICTVGSNPTFSEFLSTGLRLVDVILLLEVGDVVLKRVFCVGQMVRLFWVIGLCSGFQGREIIKPCEP